MSRLSSKLAECTAKERIYVKSRAEGMTQIASAGAAGFANPKKHAYEVEKRPHVQAALVAAMEDLADAVNFSRREAHDMLMQAYMNADTATEQINAVKAMIDLHGLAVPKKIEHEHTHKGNVSLEHMPTDELMKLAGMDDLTLEGEFEVLPDRELLEDATDGVGEND